MSDKPQHPQSEATMPASKAVRLGDLVDYAAGAVVSRTLHKTQAGTLTIFAFDEGQELSEHSAPFDAYITVLDGHTELLIGGRPVAAAAGETVLMPRNVPHAVKATSRCKLWLVMMRG